MYPSDTLSQDTADIYRVNLATELSLLRVRYGICDHDLFELRIVDLLDRRAGKDTVSHLTGLASLYGVGFARICAYDGINFEGTVVLERLGGQDERAASVCHVVHKHTDLALHISNQDHAADFVGLLTLLVDQGEIQVEPVRNRCGPLGASSIGRNDDGVLEIQILTDVFEHGRFGKQVVDGNIEEPLYLRRMQIHGDDVIAARCLQHVGDQFSRDGRP